MDSRERNRERRLRVTRFAHPDAKSHVTAMQASDRNDYQGQQLYFRSGSKELASFENHVAALVGEENNVLVFSNGMAAIVAAFEATYPTSGDIILYDPRAYGKTQLYIEHNLQNRGVQAVSIDSGDIEKIDRSLCALEKEGLGRRVKALFLETVGNHPAIPVLDVQQFLALPVLERINPVIILDNTLPTNSALPLAKHMKDSTLCVVGVESLTKFYFLNQDMGGVIFTNNDELMEEIGIVRKTIGGTPNPSVIATGERLIPPSREHFDACNRISLRNSYLLAKACAGASGAGEKFHVLYPNLSNHPNYEYASAHFPDGIAPVFFIIPDGSGLLTAEELFYRLEAAGGLEEISLTESFGYYKTTVNYSEGRNYLRFAGGLLSESATRRQGEQLQQALSQV